MGESIVEKANRWVGRAASLNDSPEESRFISSLGKPADSLLQGTFMKSGNTRRQADTAVQCGFSPRRSKNHAPPTRKCYFKNRCPPSTRRTAPVPSFAG